EPRNPCGTRREISRRFRAWLPPRGSESARRRKGFPREERYMARRPMLWSMSFARLPFDPETYLTDVRMFQQEGFGAVYLIDDEQKAIIETGTSWDAPKILEAVKTFGLQPADIDALVVSHIHLDHAGGAGFLLSDMPRARVYVHERGFKHLVDPSKLVASAHQAVNDDEAVLIGSMRQIPHDRLVEVMLHDCLDNVSPT